MDLSAYQDVLFSLQGATEIEIAKYLPYTDKTPHSCFQHVIKGCCFLLLLFCWLGLFLFFESYQGVVCWEIADI